jgi:ABC-type phosphate/phosphonate transport system substrate-binding protein
MQLFVANARMYSLEPVTAAAWRTLLQWVAKRSGIALELIDHPSPLPLETLWRRADLGCAFMCGYPFARMHPQPRLLAVPVPSPKRYGEIPVYWTEFVVRADSPLRSIDDVFGRRMAYTTETSQSGYQAPRRFLAPYARARGGSLFASVVGPLVSPRNVAAAIASGEADVGPLDSYALDLLRKHQRELTAKLRAIVSTPPTPMPPLVAAPATDADVARRVSESLYAVGDADELASVRDDLLLERFVAADPRSYDELLSRADEADRLGYARLA